MGKSKVILIVSFCSLIILLAAFFTINSNHYKEKITAWDRSRIIKIADRKKIELGYTKVDRRRVEFFSKDWEQTLTEEDKRTLGWPNRPEISKLLENRAFWQVYYALWGDVLGGDLSVFIDATTKDIITVIRGK